MSVETSDTLLWGRACIVDPSGATRACTWALRRLRHEPQGEHSGCGPPPGHVPAACFQDWHGRPGDIWARVAAIGVHHAGVGHGYAWPQSKVRCPIEYRAKLAVRSNVVNQDFSQAGDSGSLVVAEPLPGTAVAAPLGMHYAGLTLFSSGIQYSICSPIDHVEEALGVQVGAPVGRGGGDDGAEVAAKDAAAAPRGAGGREMAADASPPPAVDGELAADLQRRIAELQALREQCQQEEEIANEK